MNALEMMETPEEWKRFYDQYESYIEARKIRVREGKAAVFVNWFGLHADGSEGYWNFYAILSFSEFKKYLDPCPFELQQLEEKGKTCIELGYCYAYCYPVDPLPFMGN